jgi:hypothetical protein
MENGGNAKVNTIFEANLASSGRSKPTTRADGPTRERFIRDKYERRKFFNPSGYSMAGNSGRGAAPDASRSANSSANRPGAPSEIARQRVASRQARMKTPHSQMESNPPRRPQPKAFQAPASAPVVMDLLDFGAADPSPASAPAPAVSSNDPFAAAPAPTQLKAPPKPLAFPQQTDSSNQSTPSPAPVAAGKPQGNSTASIMALFNTPSPNPAVFGMQAGIGQTGMNSKMMQQNSLNNPQMMGQMGMNHQTTQQNMNNPQMMGQMSMNQQMIQQNMNNPQMMGQMGMNQQMMQQNMNNSNMMGHMGMNQQTNPQMLAMMNNNAQKQLMLQQQQQQQQQHAMANMGNGNTFPPQMNQMPMGGQSNSNNVMMANQQMSNQIQMGGHTSNLMMPNQQSGMNDFNAMTQGMQQMHRGTLNSNTNFQNNAGDDGGFGAPMGGLTAQSDDPFSSLGGMNAFR